MLMNTWYGRITPCLHEECPIIPQNPSKLSFYILNYRHSIQSQLVKNYLEKVSSLPRMRHAIRVNHLDGTFFCPNSQSFQAVQTDSRVKRPCSSALLFKIPSMSSRRRSCLSHSKLDRTSSTCMRSYHTNGTLSLRKSVPM